MPTVTVTRCGNLVGFADEADGPLPRDVRGLIEPELTYTYTKRLFGYGRRDPATGYDRPFHVEERRQYRYDADGRLCCSIGFLPRLSRLLAGHGYAVRQLDRSPPRERPGCYDVDYDAVVSFAYRARQEEAVARVLAHPCGVITAPPAFGKTFLVRALGKAMPKARVHVVTKRKDIVKGLVSELSLAFPNVGQIGAGKKKTGRITVITADSLHLSDGDCDILLADECFPAGTLVDGRPIETYRPGDRVWSMSAGGVVERRRVVRCFSSRPSSLVRVRMRSGASLVCTPGHPFWTPQGYVPAARLARGTRLLRWQGDGEKQAGEGVCRVRQLVRAPQLAVPDDARLFAGVQVGAEAAAGQGGRGGVQALRRRGSLLRPAAAGPCAHGPGLLLGRLPGGLQPRLAVAQPGGRQPPFCLGADAKNQPDAQGGCSGESVANAAGHTAQAARSRRERAGADEARAVVGRGDRVGDGRRGADPNAEKERLPESLQAGPGGRAVSAGGRGGRAVARGAGGQGQGRTQGGVFTVDRVDGVEVYEPAGGERAGGVCGGGLVYNLEVEGNHNYFAEGVLVHNCHELLADTYAAELARYRFSRNYGFTATPKGRKDGTDARLEALFGPVIFEMSYPEAVALGLVVPIEVRWLDVPGPHNPCAGKADTAKKRWGVWRNHERNAIIADAVRTYADEQVLILVETTEHALYLRRHLPEYALCYSEKGMDPDLLEMYRRQGLMEKDETPIDARERDRRRLAFERGELRKVIATGVWSTGVDFTGLQVLVRADAMESEIMDFQAPGRVCRLPNADRLENAGDADKTHGVVIDLRDQFDPGLHRKARKRERNYANKGWKQEHVRRLAARP